MSSKVSSLQQVICYFRLRDPHRPLLRRVVTRSSEAIFFSSSHAAFIGPSQPSQNIQQDEQS